jgi:hypothetical protein
MLSIYSSNAIPKFEFGSKVVGYCFQFVTGRWHLKQNNANEKNITYVEAEHRAIGIRTVSLRVAEEDRKG